MTSSHVVTTEQGAGEDFAFDRRIRLDLRAILQSRPRDVPVRVHLYPSRTEAEHSFGQTSREDILRGQSGLIPRCAWGFA